MEVVKWLREAGVAAERLDLGPQRGSSRPDTILAIDVAGKTVPFAVAEKRRAPYPNELPRLHSLRQGLSETGLPLLVVPFVSEPLGAALSAAEWSWADAQGNFELRAPGLLLRQRRAPTPGKPRRTSLPRGVGSLAIIRSLIRFGQGEEDEARTTTLAAQAGVSQPRASQVLHQLLDLELVERSVRGRWRANREPLLDRFLAEYRGPRGSERHLHSLDSPTEVAVLAAQLNLAQYPVVVSADVGPDLILGWRRPTVVIFYAKREVSVGGLDLVEAQGRHDANVIIRIPDDLSVFPAPRMVGEVREVEVPLADPTQMVWDLEELGGADRVEAAGMLRQWLLSRP